ncbi:arginyl-tRNA synthetase [Anaerosolibacter carboniphilus]|uniref:Arginine--tRNA ligase n=1 Tax=Anaerosolibacter carboniphilus TaxID=1417629 RepID=A0A841KXQ7_9FIRM|nr:arginine--tRNA ligase [Anaerosolibacter carboniphilus]MBB6218241.1 arginyl-tRNA synthetase [Anaerosolibacter carboniphilus]
MINFKKEIAQALVDKTGQLEFNQVMEMIEIPPNPQMGDFAFPCFKLAKEFRKSPNLIAQEIAEKLGDIELFEKVENAAAYVNFFINKSIFAQSVIGEVFDKKEKFGASDMGENKKVIVEYSSPNIAKPFHIGHIRTTVIGHAIANIFEYLGYDVVTINHLGDYGTQFGKLIVAFNNWGDAKEVEAEPIPALLKLYVKFHEEAEKRPELEDEARAWFKKLEDGDEEALKLWQWFRDESLKEFGRVYDMLGIKFDSYAGESFYSDKMPRVLELMEGKGLLKESKGAEIVDLEPHGMPPALIRKSDGSTLYITRDIAAAIYRKEHYDFYKNVYVVGSQQILHFQQWMKIIELMGNEWAKDCVHVPFGMVSLEEGTMSTRKGRVVFLEDVLNKAVEQTKEIISAKNPNLENKDEVAKQVGIGAVVFQELSNSRIKDYVFSWDKTLSFDGETGPYVQYTHARAASILRKAEVEVNTKVDYSLLANEDAMNLVRLIQQFPTIVEDAARKYEPAIISRHIVDIAQGFNKFYHDCPIIVEDKALQKSRVALVYAVKQTIQNGLALLGVAAPEKM